MKITDGTAHKKMVKEESDRKTVEYKVIKLEEGFFLPHEADLVYSSSVALGPATSREEPRGRNHEVKTKHTK